MNANINLFIEFWYQFILLLGGSNGDMGSVNGMSRGYGSMNGGSGEMSGGK